MSIITTITGLAARPVIAAAAPWLIGIGITAGLAFVGYEVHKQREIGRDEIRAEWALDTAKRNAAALAQSEANAAETARRLAAQKESQRAHDLEISRVQASAARLDAANGRLSGELAAFTTAACGAAGDTAPVCDRTTARAALGVLAELYRSARTRATVLGRQADAARTSGLQCERDYDALTIQPKGSP